MCKVHNQIGSLTTIKSHLHEHHVNEFKSLNGLINFQKNYSFVRQQITSNHKFLIGQEEKALKNDINELQLSIKAKKNAFKRQQVLKFKELNHRLANLHSVHSNIIQIIIIFIKKFLLKLNIIINKLFFNFKLAHIVSHLTKTYDKKNDRYQYIVSHFEDAVIESCLSELQEHDRKKGVIDQINSSIYGALGEQKVVKTLETLSEDYILINDFTCNFQPAIYNQKENDYIKSIQIDHILLSPSGVFLIETKNWSRNSLNNTNLYSPVQQIKRTNFVLYKILNGEIRSDKLTLNKHHWGDRKIPIRNLIVFINHKPIEEFQFVKILNLNNLLSYVNYFKPCFSVYETQKIANHLLNFTGS